MRARTIAAGLLIVLLVGGALVLALQEGFATRRTGTHLSARDGAPVSLRPVAGDEDAESDGESSTSDDSPVVSPSHGESANDEDARIRSVYRLPAEHLPGLTPLERRLALAAADAKERLPGSWYAFHDSISSLAVEAHLRCLRGELPKNGWWYVSRSNAWELDPFLESLFEMPLPQDNVRQILPLSGGRQALLMAHPPRIAILGGASESAPVPAIVSETPFPEKIPPEADPVFLAPIASEEGPWLADREGLTSPAGERRTLASEIRDRDILRSLGFDERRHTLVVRALRYAPGGRFVAIRGEIVAPTPRAVWGTADHPPQPEDLDRWETPRDDFYYDRVVPMVRGGFDGVLDRERGEVTPMRLWPVDIRSLPTFFSDGTADDETPGKNPYLKGIQRGVRYKRKFGKLTYSVQVVGDADLPEDRLILAVSPDGEHVAVVDFVPAAAYVLGTVDRPVMGVDGKPLIKQTYTRRINLLRRVRGEYATCLTIESPTPAQDSWGSEIGSSNGKPGEKQYGWQLGAGVVLNPCAAFAGSDGRTFLAHQAYEMTIWRLEETPRLLLRRPTPPLGWFAVSPAGADVLGVALKRPVEGLELAGWGTDYLIDRLDGAAPRVTDLGMAFAHRDTTAMQIALDADDRTLHVLYVESNGRLMRQDMPRP